jgi:lipid II:glycine glycyltransferase (peptidoglycan interpeptide bridge formation enzyme)
MEIVKVAIENLDRYESFLKEQSFCSFLQCSEWGAWQEAQGQKVLRFLFVEGTDVLGSAQVILKSTPVGKYFYCPYGPVFKKDLSEENINSIFEKLIATLKRDENILFVRVEPTTVLDLNKFGGVKAEPVQPPQTLLKDISGSVDDLQKSFHHKTRYNIKLAQKHEVEIKTFQALNENSKLVIDLIMQTSSRQGYRNHAESYIAKLWSYFSESKNDGISVTGYLAEKDGLSIASSLVVDFANTRMYLFGGSNYEGRNFMGPYLLHWQAMLDAKEKGLTLYDFGAGEDASGQSGGYARFKKGFNPEIVEFSGTYDFVVNSPKYTIFRALRKVNRLRLHLPFVK